jgi:hypothetical protein
MQALLRRLRAPDPRAPFTWIVALFVLACLAGSGWDLPGTDAWHNDALSPRPCGLGAVVETWRPGHFFRYPPLQTLLLTVLSLPWIALAALRAPSLGQEALLHELIQPRYMTPIEVVARAVTLLMAVGVLFNVRRLVARAWGERAGDAAAAVTALNPVLVYFSHSGNSDVPCLFWVTLALVELDRVLAGEARERSALLCAAAAALTKDQSVPLFFLAAPWALLVGPMLSRGDRTVASVALRPALWRALAASLGLYLLVAGALTNPSGYARRIAWITGPANADWVVVGRDLMGVDAILREVVEAAPLFASRAVALLALLGLALALSGRRGVSRVRAALPAVAALSYLLFFILPSRWTMERHLLPLMVLLLSYAGVAFDALSERLSPRARPLATALFGLALIPQVLDVASVDGTLMVDSRNAAQRFLAALPRGTSLEVYGGNQYLPNLPSHLRVTRVGPEPDSERSPLPGVTESRAPFREVTQRAPDYALVGEDFATYYLPTDRALDPHYARLNRDPDGRALMTGLVDGSLGYAWALRSKCELPAPLRCLRMHRSTGAETWIFRRLR